MVLNLKRFAKIETQLEQNWKNNWEQIASQLWQVMPDLSAGPTPWRADQTHGASPVTPDLAYFGIGF